MNRSVNLMSLIYILLVSFSCSNKVTRPKSIQTESMSSIEGSFQCPTDIEIPEVNSTKTELTKEEKARYAVNEFTLRKSQLEKTNNKEKTCLNEIDNKIVEWQMRLLDSQVPEKNHYEEEFKEIPMKWQEPLPNLKVYTGIKGYVEIPQIFGREAPWIYRKEDNERWQSEVDKKTLTFYEGPDYKSKIINDIQLKSGNFSIEAISVDYAGATVYEIKDNFFKLKYQDRFIWISQYDAIFHSNGDALDDHVYSINLKNLEDKRLIIFEEPRINSRVSIITLEDMPKRNEEVVDSVEMKYLEHKIVDDILWVKFEFRSYSTRNSPKDTSGEIERVGWIRAHDEGGSLVYSFSGC